jgi:hypothetical protein
MLDAMSKALGRIERLIRDEITSDHVELGTVLLNSWMLAWDHRLPGHSTHEEPTRARRKAVVRAMHSFVRKFPADALVGGKGRGILYLYEVADPLSAFWACLSVARGFVSRSEARQLMEAER